MYVVRTNRRYSCSTISSELSVAQHLIAEAGTPRADPDSRFTAPLPGSVPIEASESPTARLGCVEIAAAAAASAGAPEAPAAVVAAAPARSSSADDSLGCSDGARLGLKVTVAGRDYRRAMGLFEASSPSFPAPPSLHKVQSPLPGNLHAPLPMAASPMARKRWLGAPRVEPMPVQPTDDNVISPAAMKINPWVHPRVTAPPSS